MLVAFAANWLGLVHSWTVLLLILAGLLLAAGIYFFGFSKLASRKVQHIIDIPKNGCVCSPSRNGPVTPSSW